MCSHRKHDNSIQYKCSKILLTLTICYRSPCLGCYYRNLPHSNACVNINITAAVIEKPLSTFSPVSATQLWPDCCMYKYFYSKIQYIMLHLFIQVAFGKIFLPYVQVSHLFRQVWRYAVCSSEPPASRLGPPRTLCLDPQDQPCVTAW